ncbi:cyclic nucleotide-binding domain-containing protein [Parasulfuritortus cantonensis]|uniref:Cyclic nucleotide-binding domain-containing protein n=1 Tax=Parasulfuritortus cantonensis TaxID=2528202 RepID=A0A4R1B1X1_9PROT|nr:SpoIIE family protein phosphatase [Parasulfuritortus cantonensis]TCJ11801.1 cyclic nucleotide-binding domain-containing protein [Parasulfuritortus cantonensis]
MDCHRIPLFQGVSERRVERVLAAGRHIRLADGERLIEAGRANHYLYILLSGRMAAFLPGDRSRQGMAIEPGEAIGEMSILDGHETSAHVYSIGPSEVLAVHEDDFWRHLAGLPAVMRNLTRLVAQRLRANSERMVRAIEEHLTYENLKKELAAAHDIQMGLLPHHRPLFPRHPQVDVHAHLVPAKEVGGDLYDAFPVDDDHLLIAVGDVSGKGMPAALFMMRTVTLLRAQSGRGVPDAGFLAALNRQLCEGNEADMFVTLYVGILATRTGRLQLFNGGHPPPLLSRAGGPFEAAAGAKGALLGMLPEVRYQGAELQLQPGDRLVLYSDGVTEAENPDHELFGQARMQAALDACPAGAAPADLVAALTAAVTDFAGAADQSDDITVMVLHYLGADAPPERGDCRRGKYGIFTDTHNSRPTVPGGNPDAPCPRPCRPAVVLRPRPGRRCRRRLRQNGQGGCLRGHRRQTGQGRRRHAGPVRQRPEDGFRRLPGRHLQGQHGDVVRPRHGADGRRLRLRPQPGQPEAGRQPGQGHPGLSVRSHRQDQAGRRGGEDPDRHHRRARHPLRRQGRDRLIQAPAGPGRSTPARSFPLTPGR